MLIESDALIITRGAVTNDNIVSYKRQDCLLIQTDVVVLDSNHHAMAPLDRALPLQPLLGNMLHRGALVYSQ